MKSDIEIAQSIALKPITEIVEKEIGRAHV